MRVKPPPRLLKPLPLMTAVTGRGVCCGALTRADLEALCSNVAATGLRMKLIRFLEDLFSTSSDTANAVNGVAEATGSLQDATVLTLSSNAAFNNERVLTFDPAIFQVDDGGPGAPLIVTLLYLIALNGGYRCTFNLKADTTLDLPSVGRVPSSDDGPFADDAAAAAGGINVGEWYAKTGGTVAWRVS